ncbi:MAG TPA: hypothetical protein VN238_12090, partial [Solirubrobacteraceae bacterium]|nr:hypothetical protein [Solirubrobacteraceae bacterium]
VPFTCSEPCATIMTASLDAATRRRLGLTRGQGDGLVYATGDALAGRRATLSEPEPSLGATWRRGPLGLRVRVSAQDVSHNARTVTQTVTLRAPR